MREPAAVTGTALYQARRPLSRSGIARARARGLILAAMFATACVPPSRTVHLEDAADAGTVLAALAARERAMYGLRVAMTVRTTGGASALVSSPAYLAIEGPDALRLQVVSPFGFTVADLTIRDGAYELALPLRGETRRGTIDVAALADTEPPASERMVVALALLFRSKASADACRLESRATIACDIAAGIVAHVTVDAARRPVHERYTRADGRELVAAVYSHYADDRSGSMPGRIEIRDAASGMTMVARIQRVRRADEEAAR